MTATEADEAARLIVSLYDVISSAYHV